MSMTFQKIVTFDFFLALDTPVVIDLALLAVAWTPNHWEKIVIVDEVLGFEFLTSLTLDILVTHTDPRLTKNGLITHCVIWDAIELSLQVIEVLFLILLVLCAFLFFCLFLPSINVYVIILMEYMLDLLKILLLSHHLLHLSLQVATSLMHLINWWHASHGIQLVSTLIYKDILV